MTIRQRLSGAKEKAYRMKKTPLPLSLRNVRTYSLRRRKSLVHIEDFSRPFRPGGSLTEFLRSLPDFLAAKDFRRVVEKIARARRRSKPVILGMGAHPLKVGLSPLIVHWLEQGVLSAVAMNGAGIIHDFEVAFHGQTSEDVASEIGRGAFGMAEETGRFINQAIHEGVANGLGIGEALGRYLSDLNPAFGKYSLLLQAYLRNIPVTVHVTIGADIIHNHPSVSPAAIGEGTYRDFRILASLVAGLNEGGVYLNCGSAVNLPEVFLKCVTLVRNSGLTLQNFTTANLDFIQHYRPTENVLKRPVKNGGRGIAITGHHEITIPLLAAWLVELSPDTRNDS